MDYNKKTKTVYNCNTGTGVMMTGNGDINITTIKKNPRDPPDIAFSFPKPSKTECTFSQHKKRTSKQPYDEWNSSFENVKIDDQYVWYNEEKFPISILPGNYKSRTDYFNGILSFAGTTVAEYVRLFKEKQSHITEAKAKE